VVAALAACALLLIPGSAGAADFVVNSTGDPGTGGCDAAGCTLREAITATNGNGSSEDDHITFSVTGTISLANGLPSIATPTIISGPGASALAVQGDAITGASKTIFVVSSDAGAVRISDLTISGARAGNVLGGGISKSGTGALFVDGVVLSDNEANLGAGIAYNEGNTIITDSTLSGNRAAGPDPFGGAIGGVGGFGAPGSAQLINSTVSGNLSQGFGGAVYTAGDAVLTILSSTISSNTANSDNNVSGDGGGIYRNSSAGTLTIANTILAGNAVGTGVATPNTQCSGTFTSLGHNLRSATDPNCNGFTATGDFVDPNPMLGVLGPNGGPTPTIPLLPGSPAIEAGDPSPLDGLPPACPSVDQRGFLRGGGASVCDIGAFEVGASPPPSGGGGGGGGDGNPTPQATNLVPFNLKAAIKRCRKKFPKGKKRKKCIKRAKKRARV
jgi:CSLREA domain-containing protein